MAYDYIHQEARRIVRQYGTRDPIRIAKRMGIHVIYDNDFTTLKGMYQIIKRSRFIILNGNLSDYDRKTVCAHEIGHDRFHRHLARAGALQEFQLYDMRLRPEYEANIFAADLLIDDEEVMSFTGYDYDTVMLAGELGVDINILLIKLDEMRRQGYDVSAPYRPQSDFLGKE